MPQPQSPPRAARTRRNTTYEFRFIGGVLALAAAVGALGLRYPGPLLGRAPFAAFLGARALPFVRPSATAYGTSGEVKVRVALPGEAIEFPLEVRGNPSALSYGWERVGTEVHSVLRPLAGANLTVPSKPGFYRLIVGRGNSRRVVNELSVAVLMPFEQKVGSVLNGYRIGTYLAERLGGKRLPKGFLEIMPGDLELELTKHLRVRDLVNHDEQTTWPRYAAVSPKLLDKLELVVAEVARWHDADSVKLDVDVRSGFRSPEHNRRVRRAARDSRHQYGDAADVSMDANGDGRFTELDSRLVGLAVEIVELRHPELSGGLGLYLRGQHPYVHIDARGRRARWRG